MPEALSWLCVALLRHPASAHSVVVLRVVVVSVGSSRISSNNNSSRILIVNVDVD